MNSYKTAILLFTTMLAASPAKAADTPLEPFNLNAKYTVAWNGITLGRIRVHASEQAGKYSLSVDTKTHGIGSMFSNEKRVATAQGKYRPGGSYIPTRYESIPMDETEGRRTNIRYDTAGIIDDVSRIPQEDPNWRPRVAPVQIGRAVDSATTGLILRQKLYQASAAGKTDVSATSFDGARLANIQLHATKPEARVQVMNNYVPALKTLVTRKPIAGYTSKELKKFNAGDPTIYLYFSADSKFIPLLATADTGFGQLSATLSEID